MGYNQVQRLTNLCNNSAHLAVRHVHPYSISYYLYIAFVYNYNLRVLECECLWDPIRHCAAMVSHIKVVITQSPANCWAHACMPENPTSADMHMHVHTWPITPNPIALIIYIYSYVCTCLSWTAAPLGSCIYALNYNYSMRFESV